MTVRRVPPYTALANVYERAGFTRFSEEMTPRYLALAQEHDWAGRRVLDLACGVGVSAVWLATQNYRVTGIDSSAAMLRHAQARADRAQLIVDWQQGDIRKLELPADSVELAMCMFDSLNYMRSLRDLEAVFGGLFKVMAPGGMFVFDMSTIRGLAEKWGTGCHVVYDNEDDLMVLVRSSFNYESLTSTMRVGIHTANGDAWQRMEEIHVERAYPIQAVVALLERAGWRLIGIYDENFTPSDPVETAAYRAIFLSQRPG